MIVTCVTTRYLPNLSHLARVAEVDTCVILDLAPLPDRNRDSFINRNQVIDVRTQQQHWLTVPITRQRGLAINQVRTVATQRNWTRKHIQRLRYFYPNHETLAPGFIGQIEEALHESGPKLVDINFQVLSLLLDLVVPGTKKPIFQSQFKIPHGVQHRSQIAKALGAKRYRAGSVEIDLISQEPFKGFFESSGIEVSLSNNVTDDEIPANLFINTSAIHPLLSIGISATRRMMELAMQKLSSH